MSLVLDGTLQRFTVEVPELNTIEAWLRGARSIGPVTSTVK